MLALLELLDIPVQKQRLMQSFFGMFSMGPLLATVVLLGFLFLVGLGLGVFVGGRMADGFVVPLAVVVVGLVRTDKFVLVAEYLLFGLQQLQIRGGGLRHSMVILYFEFASHHLITIILRFIIEGRSRRRRKEKDVDH